MYVLNYLAEIKNKAYEIGQKTWWLDLGGECIGVTWFLHLLYLWKFSKVGGSLKQNRAVCVMMVAVLTHGGQESHCTCFHKRSTAVSSLVLILQRGLFPSLSLLQVPHCWAVAWCPKLSTALPVSVKYAEKFRSQVFGTKRFKVHVC